MAKTEKTDPTAVETAPPATGPREKRKPGRPKLGTDRIPMVQQFWHRADAFDPKDWGTRVWITIYRLRPLIDRMRSGQPKKLGKFGFKIDEEWLKANHGSGTYRLYLNYKAPEAQEKEIDTVDVDIYDPSFPPNIPDEEFLKIPENADWEWCRPLLKKNLPALLPVQSSGVQDVLETFKTFDQIQTTLAAKAQAQQPAAAIATPAPPAADPFASGMSFAKEILQMKSDNPMVDMMRDELKDMRAEIRAERERSERLQIELRSKENQPAQKPGLGFLKDLVTEAQSIGLIPAGGLQSLWGKAEGALQAVTRSRMSGSEEFWQPIIIGIADAIKPALPMVVARLVASKPQQQPQQQPTSPVALPSPAPQQPGAPPAPAPPVNGAPAPATAPTDQPIDPAQAQAFFVTFGPALIRFFKEGVGDGADFAQWIYDGHGADWQGLKWMHLKKSVGTEQTVTVFKGSPYWPEIAAAEPQFTEFIKAFIEWQPEAAQSVVELDNENEDDSGAN